MAEPARRSQARSEEKKVGLVDSDRIQFHTMAGDFQPTRWSLLRQAVDSDAVLHERAWEEVHRLYRHPLLSFIRRAGWSADQAEDLLQSFFAKLAHREWLGEADPKLGKARTFLLSRLTTHLNDARKHDRALKRKGQGTALSLDDGVEGEALLAEATVDSFEALAKVFDREWAEAILGRVLTGLGEEAARRGNGELFKLLRSQLTDDSPKRFRDAAAQLGQSEGALRVALHRLRGRFRDLIREEVAATILPGDDVSAEIGYLAEVLASS